MCIVDLLFVNIIVYILGIIWIIDKIYECIYCMLIWFNIGNLLKLKYEILIMFYNDCFVVFFILILKMKINLKKKII